MTIRAMEIGDLEAARSLWAAAEGVEISEGDSVEELARYLARNPGASQVALAGNKLVGAVLAGYDGQRGILYHLAVTPKERGCGVGRELLRASLRKLSCAASDVR